MSRHLKAPSPGLHLPRCVAEGIAPAGGLREAGLEAGAPANMGDGGAMRHPDLELDLLRAFVAVAETGSFTAAADVVHRSQSAVSRKSCASRRSWAGGSSTGPAACLD